MSAKVMLWIALFAHCLFPLIAPFLSFKARSSNYRYAIRDRTGLFLGKHPSTFPSVSQVLQGWVFGERLGPNEAPRSGKLPPSRPLFVADTPAPNSDDLPEEVFALLKKVEGESIATAQDATRAELMRRTDVMLKSQAVLSGVTAPFNTVKPIPVECTTRPAATFYTTEELKIIIEFSIPTHVILSMKSPSSSMLGLELTSSLQHFPKKLFAGLREKRRGAFLGDFTELSDCFATDIIQASEKRGFWGWFGASDGKPRAYVRGRESSQSGTGHHFQLWFDVSKFNPSQLEDEVVLHLIMLSPIGDISQSPFQFVRAFTFEQRGCQEPGANRSQLALALTPRSSTSAASWMEALKAQGRLFLTSGRLRDLLPFFQSVFTMPNDVFSEQKDAIWRLSNALGALMVYTLYSSWSVHQERQFFSDIGIPRTKSKTAFIASQHLGSNAFLCSGSCT